MDDVGLEGKSVCSVWEWLRALMRMRVASGKGEEREASSGGRLSSSESSRRAGMGSEVSEVCEEEDERGFAGGTGRGREVRWGRSCRVRDAGKERGNRVVSTSRRG